MCVNDVITHNKLQDQDCYHIILHSRHNKLAKNIMSLCPETGNENPLFVVLAHALYCQRPKRHDFECIFYFILLTVITVNPTLPSC